MKCVITRDSNSSRKTLFVIGPGSRAASSRALYVDVEYSRGSQELAVHHSDKETLVICSQIVFQTEIECSLLPVMIIFFLYKARNQNRFLHRVLYWNCHCFAILHRHPQGKYYLGSSVFNRYHQRFNIPGLPILLILKLISPRLIVNIRLSDRAKMASQYLPR